MQTIPAGAADFHVDRLKAHGVAAANGSRFGMTPVMVLHPCGSPHELVENPADTRRPILNAVAGTTAQTAIRGIHGAGIAVYDVNSMDEFLSFGMNLTQDAKSDEGLMFAVPDTMGPHSVVEILPDNTSPQGRWMLAGGTIHHMAQDTVTEDGQHRLKAQLEGGGFTDVSAQKDRNYFQSMYVRSPGGALFEIAWSIEGGLGAG